VFTWVPLLLISTQAAFGIICSTAKGPDRDGDRWYWREIEGRRCWYKGDGRLPKSELHWTSDALLRPSKTAPPKLPPQQPEGTYGLDVPPKPAEQPKLSSDRLRAVGQERAVEAMIKPLDTAPEPLVAKQVKPVVISRTVAPPKDDLKLGMYFALFGTATLLSVAFVGLMATRRLRGKIAS
jgi:hypothetical protein